MKNVSKQQGFVSLLTTILLSLLLIIITLSMVSLEALQLRKAEDSEQTLRAYYAAEAGVEDAVGQILTQGKAAATTGCGPGLNSNLNYDISGKAGWTCQQISFTGAPEGTLDTPDQAQTIDPYDSTGSGANYQSVLVEFSVDSNSISDCYYTFNCNAAPWGAYPVAGFPTAASFAANPKAAPIELSIVQYPHNGFSSSQVCPNGAAPSGGCTVRLQNAVVVPGGPGGTGVIDYSQPLGGNPSQPYQATCSRNLGWTLPGNWGQPKDTVNSYHCVAAILNLPSSCGGGGNCDYLFRIRSRFGNSAFRFVFMPSPNATGASGGSVTVPTGAALIDVTARAGDTFRRVISRMPVGGQASGGLNYVIYSDGDVCKNFTVINNVAQSGCPY